MKTKTRNDGMRGTDLERERRHRKRERDAAKEREKTFLAKLKILKKINK